MLVLRILDGGKVLKNPAKRRHSQMLYQAPVELKLLLVFN
jgi:hypothetical protein